MFLIASYIMNPARLCSKYILFSISTLEYIVPIYADYMRSWYYHPQNKLTYCQVPELGGVKDMARSRTLL